MNREPPYPPGPKAADRVLQAYLLGSVEFEAALALQRRLAFEAAGEPHRAAVIFCEHPPLVTVGRQGSRSHILCEPDELRARRWPVRWVNRGGGCVFHAPGQLAIYPILALPHLGIGLHDCLVRLQETVLDLLRDFTLTGQTRPGTPCVWLGERPVAVAGLAVCNWITYYGVVLNVNPDLEPFRRVLCTGRGGSVMTSLERERRAPLRPALVRERFLEHFAARFGFARTSLFFDHPALSRKAPSDAVISSR